MGRFLRWVDLGICGSSEWKGVRKNVLLQAKLFSFCAFDLPGT